MGRIIFHIDVNNAFLSWTAVDMLRNGSNIDIRNIPSCIGGDEEARKGIVVAKSPVAKKYGIVTAETLYSARKKCPDLKVFPSDMELYKKESNKLYQYFLTLTPTVERYSIDECFLDFTGTNYLYPDYMELAKNIQKYINENFGITINIGIAENKFCAKMASDFSKPNKIHTLFMNEIEEKLWPLPVDDMFMVGKSSAKILHQLGIHTIGELAKSNDFVLSKYFKSNAHIMIEHANGIDFEMVNSYRVKDKSISISETLPEDISDLSKLKQILLYQADKIGRTLRKRKKYTSVIAVIFKTSNFVSYSHQKKLDNATNVTEEIYNAAVEILESGYRGEAIRLIGLRLDNLTDDNCRQVSLFERESHSNVEKLQNVMDNINDRYGDLSILPASMKKKN